MLIAFQILLMLVIFIFSLMVVAEKESEKQNIFVAVLLASILTMFFTFYI